MVKNKRGRATPRAVAPKQTMPLTNSEPMFTWESISGSIFVFAVTCGVYVVTAYPSVVGGDSGTPYWDTVSIAHKIKRNPEGELLAAACSTGVAHPPGYRE